MQKTNYLRAFSAFTFRAISACSLFICQQALAEEDIFSLSLEELLEIRVQTASGQSEDIETAPSTIFVISEKEILSNGYVSLSNLLENIPGVVPIDLSFFSFGGQRGFLSNFSQTLLLIDGREVQNLIAAETFISHQFATHNVKQVEIINGPGSALYGANAFVGVINIITKSSDDDYQGFEVQSEVGSENTYALNLVFGKNVGRFRFSGAARKYQSDEWDFSNFVQDGVNFSQGLTLVQQNTNSIGQVGFNNDSVAENLSLKINYDAFYIGNENYDLETGKGLENVAADYTSQIDKRKFRLTYAGWKGSLSSESQLSVEAKVYKELFWGRNILFSQESYEQIISERIVQGVDPELPLTDREIVAGFSEIYSQLGSPGSRRDNINVQYDTSSAFDWNLTLGYTFDKQDIRGVALSDQNSIPVFNDLRADSNTHRKPFYLTYKRSGYVQIRKTLLADKLNLTLGARYDQHSIYGNIKNFRGGLSYSISDKTTIKGLFGQAFREPNIFELGALTETSNLDLEPAEIDTFELAISHFFAKTWKLNATYYVNSATNFIEPTSTLEFVNSDRVIRGRGIESQIHFQADKWSGELNYTYTDSDNTDLEMTDLNGLNTGVTQSVKNLNNYEHRSNLGINYELNESIRLNTRFNYYSRVKAEHGNSQVVQVVDIPSAIKTNLTLSFHGYNTNGFDISGFLTFKNLFNEQFFQANVRNGGPKQFLQPGRQLIAKVILRF